MLDTIRIKGGIILLEQTQTIKSATEIPAQQQFGGGEILGIHELLGGIIGSLEHSSINEQHVQDQQLMQIMQHQKAALTQIYNTIVDTLQTGTVPTVKTQTYQMQEAHTALYGFKPSAPKQPITSTIEINDECISSALLGHLKGIAKTLTASSIEATNPILRRIMADSVPNVIEMAYEMFLYQNQKEYYQVPQLPVSDMQAIINGFAKIQPSTIH